MKISNIILEIVGDKRYKQSKVNLKYINITLVQINPEVVFQNILNKIKHNIGDHQHKHALVSIAR